MPIGCSVGKSIQMRGITDDTTPMEEMALVCRPLDGERWFFGRRRMGDPFSDLMNGREVRLASKAKRMSRRCFSVVSW